MIDIVLGSRVAEKGEQAEGPSANAISAAILVHVAIFLLLALVATSRPLPRPATPRSIEIDIITELEYRDEFEVPPDVVTAPLAVRRPTEAPDAVPPAPADGMTKATELFASRVLADPENRQARDTLPLLEQSERITQLCNIEGLEQLNLARPKPFPDSIAPSAFAPTTVRNLTLEATQAAYRAARNWYRLRFTCTVSSDFAGVEAYAFELGDAIPQSEWEAHDLIAEDEDE